ncbi:MAG: hypothetical protein EOP86_17245 [Verrucomicrobiaceae bacterium]|nr:MAG: hypothetical protein EOP86_17245 [Verrucomicrobiaceae bacterium]
MNPPPSDALITVEPRTPGNARLRHVSRKGGVGLKDMLVIFFRHKKKIIFLTLLGLAGGVSVYFQKPIIYQSQAKLLVKYVLSRNALDAYESEVGMTGRYMKATLDAELQILTSWDIFTKVAEIVGPEKILPADAQGKSTVAAAAAIQKNLVVENGRDSQVITLSYSNASADVPAEILKEFVRQYFIRHLAIHRPGSAIAAAIARSDKAKTDMEKAENELMTLQTELGVTALSEALSSLETQRIKAHEALMLAEAELLAMQANVTALEPVSKGSTGKNEPSLPAEPSFADVEAYRTQLLRKESLLAEQNRILQSYTSTSERARNIRERIDAAEAVRLELLKKNPLLIRAGAAGSSVTAGARPPWEEARSQIPGMSARVDFLKKEAAGLDDRLKALTSKVPEYERLQRTKKINEDKYTLNQREKDKAMVDEELDNALDKTDVIRGTDMPNIDIIQQPTVPILVPDKKTTILALGLPLGGLAMGMGLALLIELLLDQSVKRPQEIESSLQLPLMLSIPLLKAPSSTALKARRQLDAGATVEGALARDAGDPSIAWDENHFMRPFADAIRDRLGYYFDQNGLTHKPKLIGLTGFSDDAGTSTLASSLAASFAETVEGRVLFVDLTRGHSESISLGQQPPVPVESHSADGTNGVEEEGDFGVRQQKENLFVAKVPPRNGKTFTPRKLFELLPKFRASSFEYIIFDMPPMGTTSPTLGMAGMMDKLLLIVDAGKTSREVIRRGFQELSVTRADISTILNKTEENLPAWLQG